MIKFRAFVCACLVGAAGLPADAGEMEDWDATAAQFSALFEKEDFGAIEALYAQASAGNKRTESGLFVANRLMRTMFARRPREGPHGNDAYWTPAEQKAERWMGKFPDSTLAAVALARAHLGHGWDYRGGRFARDVPAADWKQLETHTRLAREALARREERGRLDPNWWVTMLDLAQRGRETPTLWATVRDLARGDTGERSYERLAEEALKAFPRNHDIYFEIANKLQPKWGGSMEDIAALADNAVARTRDREGQTLYARIYWTLYAESNDPGFVRRPDVSWPKIRAGFDDMLKRYPAAWNVNYFARMACDARDKPTTQRLFKLIGDKPDPRAWTGRAQFNGCHQWAQ